MAAAKGIRTCAVCGSYLVECEVEGPSFRHPEPAFVCPKCDAGIPADPRTQFGPYPRS